MPYRFPRQARGGWALPLLLGSWLNLLLAPDAAAQGWRWQQALSSLTAPGTNGTCAPAATASDADGNVFVAGYFTGTVRFGTSQLVSVNQYYDVFVAKWSLATQTWAWATSGGGGYNDLATGVAVRGHQVLVTGHFTCNTNTPVTAVIAGVSLPGAGDVDVFLASYQDLGSAFANDWAVSGGGRGGDYASGGLALLGNEVYVAGTYDKAGSARFAGASLPATDPSFGSSYGAFLAKYPVPAAGPPGTGWATDLGSSAPVTTPFRVAAGSNGVYVVGTYQSSASSLTLGGTTFTSPPTNGHTFLLKCLDNGGSASTGWALLDQGYAYALALRGSTLYTAGGFTGAGTIAGSALVSAGKTDVFLARYQDVGANGAGAGAARDGGPDDDFAQSVALEPGGVLVAGTVGTAATVAGTALNSPAGLSTAFVAQYADNGIGFGSGWALAPSSGANSGASRALPLSDGRVLVVGGASAPVAFDAQTLTPANSSAGFDFLAVATNSPLPVTLVSFAAAPVGPVAVRLAWATASETNSARFEIERSPDGVRFARVGAVAAQGTKATPTAYAFRDELPPGAGNRPVALYYRLRQVDQDGTAAYSPVRAVEFEAAAGGLRVFPNPAAGPVALTGAAPGAAVRVLDALGQVVAVTAADATGAAALPTPGRPGVYMVQTQEQTCRWVAE